MISLPSSFLKKIKRVIQLSFCFNFMSFMSRNYRPNLQARSPFQVVRGKKGQPISHFEPFFSFSFFRSPRVCENIVRVFQFPRPFPSAKKRIRKEKKNPSIIIRINLSIKISFFLFFSQKRNLFSRFFLSCVFLWGNYIS